MLKLLTRSVGTYAVAWFDSRSITGFASFTHIGTKIDVREGQVETEVFSGLPVKVVVGCEGRILGVQKEMT